MDGKAVVLAIRRQRGVGPGHRGICPSVFVFGDEFLESLDVVKIEDSFFLVEEA
jgi:hypothetical protein